MPIPPDPILRGAVRWLEHLPSSGVIRLRALFSTHPAYNDLTPTQYESALVWLEGVGLLAEVEVPSEPCALRVLDAAITHGGAFWFRDADILVRSPEDLPSDLARAADALGVGYDRAFTQLAACWGKVDLESRKRIGDAGEKQLVEVLGCSTNAKIGHVALWSDGYGYDVSVESPVVCQRIEVKSTTRRGRLTVYLSRNEFETMQTDPLWTLVVVRLFSNLVLDAVATVSTEWIQNHAPVDYNVFGRWESCRFEVPPEALTPGMPGLMELDPHDESGIFNGDRWRVNGPAA
ncbi:MAG: DUF3883 domain-containing protein [Candidatus Nanopelagicales bacterium]